MGFNPLVEGIAAGQVYDERGTLISQRVVWATDISRADMEALFAKGWADFAIVENNTDNVLLVTDEFVDGEYRAHMMACDGDTNWHTLRVVNGKQVRYEPEDYLWS